MREIKISDELYELIDDESKGIAFDSQTETVNYYIRQGYKNKKEKDDSSTPEPSFDTLQEATTDVNDMIEKEYNRFVRINDRSIQLLELNGIIPAAYLALLSERIGSSHEWGVFFMIGLFLFLCSAVVAVWAYLMSSPPTPSEDAPGFGINDDDLELIVNEEMTQGEYLWWMLEKSRFPWYDGMSANNKSQSRKLLLSSGLLFFGVASIGAEIVMSW